MSDTVSKLVTYDDYQALPDDGNQYQIIGGKLYMTAAPFTKHQRTVRNIFLILDDYVVQNDLGEVFFAPFDVVLSMTDVVQPDVLFIAKERLNIITQKNIVAAPDLIVEVLSPATRQIDRNPKKALYTRHGVKEYWLADPESQSMQQFVLKDNQLVVAGQADSKTPSFKSHLLENLVVELQAIFK